MSDFVGHVMHHVDSDPNSQNNGWFVQLVDGIKLYGKIKRINEGIYAIDDGNITRYFSDEKVIFITEYDT